jgi:hypothetical protein
VRSLVAAALFITGLSGCGVNLAAITSGQIGCAESDITISDDESGYHTRTWVADCGGKTYYCSAADVRHALVASSSAAGCEFDLQCKGDRICKAGRCVEPAAKPAGDGGANAQ